MNPLVGEFNPWILGVCCHSFQSLL